MKNERIAQIAIVILAAIASLYPAWYMIHVSFDGLVEWNCFKKEGLYSVLCIIGFFLQFFFVSPTTFTMFNVYEDSSGRKYKKESNDITDSLMAGCVMPLLLHLVIFPMLIGAGIYYVIMAIIALLAAVAPYVLALLLVLSAVLLWFLAEKVMPRKYGMAMAIAIGVLFVAVHISLGYFLSMPSSNTYNKETEKVEAPLYDAEKQDSKSDVGTESTQKNAAGQAEAMYSTSDDFAWLSEREVTAADLAGKSSSELRILRNAIYARHGYIFKSADLKEYFGQFDWYKPISSNVDLSELELNNVNFIKRYE